MCIDVGVCHSGYWVSEASPSLTSERVGISGYVMYRWKARHNLTSGVYQSFLNLAQFFKMAAKMADFMKNAYTRITWAILKLFYKL